MSTSLEHWHASAIAEGSDALAGYIQVLSDNQVTKYTTVASYTVLVYDMLITLDRYYSTFPVAFLHIFLNLALLPFSEREFVWKSRVSLGMVMYLIMRYGTILLLGIGLFYALWPEIPFKFCKIWFYIDNLFGATLMVIPVFGILALRTYALYHQNKTFKRVLILLYVLVVALLIVCVIIQAATAEVQQPLPGLTCHTGVTITYNRVLAIQYLAPVVYECIIFVLTFYRILASWHNVRIAKVILWDCLLYYAVIVSIGFASVALLFGLPMQRKALTEVLIPFLRTSFVILASRLVLRLRQYVRDPSMSLSTLSTPPVIGSDDWD